MVDMLKNISIILVFKVFGALSILMVSMIIGQYYGPEKLGIFSLIVSLLMIGSVLSKVGLDTYTLKIVSELDGNLKEIALYIKKIIKIIFLTGLLTSMLFFILSDFINEYVFKSFNATYYVTGLAIIAIPFAYIGVLPEIFRALGGVGKYSFFRSISQNLLVLILISAGILTNIIVDPIYALYSSIGITIVLILLYLYLFLKKRGINIFASGLYKKSVLRHSYPMALTSTMMLMVAYTDSFMIGYYINEYQVGVYSACISIASIFLFAQTSINVYVAPKISRCYSRGDLVGVKHLYASSTKLLIVVSLFILLVVSVFSDLFLGLYGSKFLHAEGVLLIVSTGYFINSCFGVVGYLLNMTNNQFLVMVAVGFGSVLNVYLNYMLIPDYYLYGAAIASLLTMLLLNFTLFLIGKHRKLI